MSTQLALFSQDPAEPQGLRYQREFVSSEEESALIADVRALPLTPFQFGAFEGKRRVAWFGWRYDYSRHKLEQAGDLPAWLAPIIARVEAFAGPRSSPVRQVLCTEYEQGVGIGWHRDKPHFDEIFGLSLASACKLRFRRKQGTKWQRFALEAQPRSLYMLSGDSRYVWEHGIPAVEALRYSITFRTMRKETSNVRAGDRQEAR